MGLVRLTELMRRSEIMKSIEELQKELAHWQDKYEEADADQEEAEQRMSEAESMCDKIEEQLERLRNETLSNSIDAITQYLSEPLDFHAAILKASIFASTEAHKQNLQYVAITENQVIGCDGYRVYIANVEIPADKKNTFVKLDEQKQEIAVGNIEDKHYLEGILKTVERKGLESVMEVTNIFFKSKITYFKPDHCHYETCVLEEPFIRVAFQKKFIDEALAVMSDGLWSFDQTDNKNIFLISNTKETIGILPVRLRD